MSPLPLAVWTTGCPVPGAQRTRGSFFDMIRRHAAGAWSGPWQNWNCVEVDEELPSPDEVAGLIVTGSPARLGTRAAWMIRTEEALVPFAEASTPVLGICFGHQLLGSGLGGLVAPNPKGREIGTPLFELHDDEDELFGEVSSPADHVVMTHLDSVVELPPGAQRLGTTHLEPHAAIRFSQRTWGVQFHPEMDHEIVGHYMDDRAEDITLEGFDLENLKSARVRSEYGKRLLRRFIQICCDHERSRR